MGAHLTAASTCWHQQVVGRLTDRLSATPVAGLHVELVLIVLLVVIPLGLPVLLADDGGAHDVNFLVCVHRGNSLGACLLGILCQVLRAVGVFCYSGRFLHIFATVRALNSLRLIAWLAAFHA